MDLEKLYQEIKSFSDQSHGSSDYDNDEFFVKGSGEGVFAPLRYLKKKVESLKDQRDLIKGGFVIDALDFIELDGFPEWYERQFGRKLLRKFAKKICILQEPNNKAIFHAIEQVNQCYTTLRNQKIILNGKNLPVQLGEWYAKCIFGLSQNKSASQRGFDFILQDGKRVEVKVEWGDAPTHKGVKIKKSLVELSDYCIVIYVGFNLMIREVCFLDSDFIIRKFADKGHTIFMKDSDVSAYFFSRSNRHDDKIANSSALLKFCCPNLAMKIAERF